MASKNIMPNEISLVRYTSLTLNNFGANSYYDISRNTICVNIPFVSSARVELAGSFCVMLGNHLRLKFRLSVIVYYIYNY